MKKKLVPLSCIAFCTFTLLALYSCEDQPWETWQYVSVSHPGDPGYEYYTGTQKMALPQFGCKIDCEPNGDNCQDEVNFWGAVYDDVTVYRTKLDSFYTAYFEDDMDNFVRTQDLRGMFPYVETSRPGAIDSVEAGSYKIFVADGDSSIVFYKDPFDSLGAANLVFAIDRNAHQQ